MNVDYKQLGFRISIERKNKKLTQEQLAEKIGMSANYVSNIENNYSIPSLETFINICTALEVTPDCLLLGAIIASDYYLKDDIANKINKCNDKERRLVMNFIDWILDERANNY